MIVVDGEKHIVTGAGVDFSDTFNTVVKRKSRLVQIYGDHNVTKPLNCANKRHTTVFDWSGARLYAGFHEDYLIDKKYAVIDMTRSTGNTHTGLYLSVQETVCSDGLSRSPAFGILQSRDHVITNTVSGKTGSNKASGKNRFYNCNVAGALDVGFYNIGAEVSEVYGLNVSIDKPNATAGVYMANINVLRAQSPFDYEPGNNSSATGAVFHGLHIRCDKKGNTTHGLVIDGFDEIKIYGVYMRTSGEYPYVVVDSTNDPVDGVHIDGFSSHGKPTAAMKIKGKFNNGIVNLRVIAQEMEGTVPISIDEVDLISGYFEHSEIAGVHVDPGAQLRNVKENGRERVRDLDQTPAR